MYVRQAAAINVPLVPQPDRKDLLSYLNGETSALASIYKSAPLKNTIQVKRTADEGLKSVAKKPRFEETRVQKVKEQLAARLGAPKEASVTVDNIKTLPEVMSVEKIAVIKANHLAMKRTTKEEKDIRLGSHHRVMLDVGSCVTKDIISREQQGRTCTTVLQSTEKTFAESIFAILKSVEDREKVQNRCPQTMPVVTPCTAPISFKPQPAVYGRYDQERFIKQKKETDGFEIDTLMTFHGMSLKSVAEGAKPKKVQTLSQPIIPQPKPVAEAQIAVQPKRISRTPIIIVPSAATSLITMYNATDILQDLRFVSTEEKKFQGAKWCNKILLQRQKGVFTVPYQVIDNPQKLRSEDWDRVVAVFVMGSAWQFKGWPWGGNPVEIFSKNDRRCGSDVQLTLGTQNVNPCNTNYRSHKHLV